MSDQPMLWDAEAALRVIGEGIGRWQARNGTQPDQSIVALVLDYDDIRALAGVTVVLSDDVLTEDQRSRVERVLSEVEWLRDMLSDPRWRRPQG